MQKDPYQLSILLTPDNLEHFINNFLLECDMDFLIETLLRITGIGVRGRVERFVEIEFLLVLLGTEIGDVVEGLFLGPF